MTGESNVSVKVKTCDRDRAKALANRFNVNSTIVVRAWRRCFDKLKASEQQVEIDAVRRLHPSTRPPRIGRGNRSPMKARV